MNGQRTLFDQPAGDSAWRATNTAMFSSATGEWATPQDVFDGLNAEFDFTLDPCCTHNTAKCEKHYTASEDGLARSWRGERVFLNPPYGREIGKWIAKAYEEALQGAIVVCLLPARTDTRWWHDYCMKGQIRLLRGRLKFGGAKNNAPFPSALVIFRPPAKAIRPHFADPDDAFRLETQNGKILALLRQGPATNDQLSRIARNYTARISDIRDFLKNNCGQTITTLRGEGGLFTYWIETWEKQS